LRTKSWRKWEANETRKFAWGTQTFARKVALAIWVISGKIDKVLNNLLIVKFSELLQRFIDSHN